MKTPKTDKLSRQVYYCKNDYLYINVHVEFVLLVSPDAVMADIGCSTNTLSCMRRLQRLCAVALR